ncbi:MAG: hypothetical protein HOQ22_13955 [Nocardioidaceae bacterium]|nr:hypothetical protein [Nocardioidaceae bacterium]NUS52129.1 hypothetical protein [Nocardioidaceae bacterium]
MIRRVLAPLLSLVCLVALASCNDSGGGSDAPKTVDGIPAYAAANTEKGAQNFARYWVDVLNKATVTGDTKKLESLQKDSCEGCKVFTDRLNAIYQAGGHVETKGFNVKTLLTDSSIPKPGAGVSATLTATPQTVVEKKGAKPTKRPGGDVRVRLIMVRENDHWVMDRIDLG